MQEDEKFVIEEKSCEAQNLARRGIRLCFVSSYPPSRGRLSEYSHNLINEIQKLPDIEHIDVLVNVDGTLKKEATNVKKKISIHQAWVAGNPLSLLFLPMRVLSLNPDLVHFNVHFAVFGSSRLVNFIGLSLPLLCRVLGFKTLVTLHNVVERIDIEKNGYHDTFLNRLGTLIATKLLTCNSSLVVTMKSYVELFKKRYKCKETVWIPHGTWDVNPRTRIPHNPQTILYFGHSGPYKDLDLLFKTFEIVTNRKSTVRLVVAGASHPNYPHFLDSYRSRNSPSNVQFTGYIPEDELQSFFTHIDVVVLPYHTCTGTSGVAHLASSYGLPIVATDLPEFRELIEEGCKIMLSPHDPFALAKKIEYVLDNPNLMLELGKQSLVFARGRTWERIAVLFRDLYKQLTSNSARQPKPLSLNRTWLSFRPFISTSKEKYQGASSLGSETGEA